MARRPAFAAAEAALRVHALAKPEATEHFPWGERAIKVKGKVFLFMRAEGGELSLSTKLPDSHNVALMLPFAESTGYGLGKAGWVTARFAAGDAAPLDMLCAWIDESYQAIAPAKLAAVARGDAARSPARQPPKKPARSSSNKPAASKPSNKPARSSSNKPAARVAAARSTKRPTAKPRAARRR